MQVSCPYLVGRDAEMAVLRERLADARAGRGGMVFVTGQPGVGKSRLVRELADTARGDGVAVFVGRAVPTSGQVAYRPVAEVVAQILRGRAVPEDPTLTSWLPALQAIMPGVATGGPHDDSATRAVANPELCGEALLRLLRWVRGADPLVLILEDLGWADPDTVALVDYLAGNLVEESVLCVCTVRPERASMAWDLVQRVCQRGAALSVPLAPLGNDAVTEMVRACMPEASDEAVARVRATADGIPLMVEEVLATPGVPETIEETVRARTAALERDDASVLGAAAVLGRDFDWELLPTITGLSSESVINALERLVSALLISVDGERFRFRHALIREAVVAAMIPPRRTALARATLAALDEARPGHDHAELAVQAGYPARAAAMLAASGRESLRRGALATAVATLRRSTELSPDPGARAETQTALVTALSLAGRLDEALAVGQELLARHGPDADPIASIHLDLARAAVAATRWPTASTHLDAATVALKARPDPGLSAQASALTGEVALATGDLDAAREAAGAAFAAAEVLNLPEIACHALELIGRSHRVHDLTAARAAFTRAYEIADHADLPLWRLRALHELGTIDLLDHAGIDTFLVARQQADQLGALSVAAVVDVQLAAAYITRFELDPARACARRAAALARRLRLVRLHAMALLFDANVSVFRNDRSELDDLAAAALRAAPDDREIEGLVATSGQGILELLWGDRAAALSAMDRGVALLMGVPTAAPTPAWGLRALLHAVMRWPDAADSVEQARAYGATASRLNRGCLSYAEAVLTRSPDAVAAGDADLVHFPVWRHIARALVAEAALADRWGTPQAWLRDARTCFDAQGLPHLARHCGRLLGEVPRWTPAGVSARELEVLELVAGGLTNREIAARLHLSVRTVEKHVESLLRKADARSRTQLVAMLGGTT